MSLQQFMHALVTPQVFAAVIAAVGVIATLLWNARAAAAAREDERKAVMAAYRSDIRSIVLVIEQLQVVDRFTKVAAIPPDAVRFPRWRDYCPGDEGYFDLYQALASKIGTTGHEMSREVVKFYAFLRASRDAASGFEALTDREAQEGQHIDLAKSVLQALDEMMQAANEALHTRFSSAEVNSNDGQEMAQRLHEKIRRAIH